MTGTLRTQHDTEARCETCRFWQYIEPQYLNGGWGFCDAAEGSSDDVTMRSHRDRDHIVTAPSHSCPMWESA